MKDEGRGRKKEKVLYKAAKLIHVFAHFAKDSEEIIYLNQCECECGS